MDEYVDIPISCEGSWKGLRYISRGTGCLVTVSKDCNYETLINAIASEIGKNTSEYAFDLKFIWERKGFFEVPIPPLVVNSDSSVKAYLRRYTIDSPVLIVTVEPLLSSLPRSGQCSNTDHIQQDDNVIQREDNDGNNNGVSPPATNLLPHRMADFVNVLILYGGSWKGFKYVPESSALTTVGKDCNYETLVGMVADAIGKNTSEYSLVLKFKWVRRMGLMEIPPVDVNNDIAVKVYLKRCLMDSSPLIVDIEPLRLEQNLPSQCSNIGRYKEDDGYVNPLRDSLIGPTLPFDDLLRGTNQDFATFAHIIPPFEHLSSASSNLNGMKSVPMLLISSTGRSSGRKRKQHILSRGKGTVMKVCGRCKRRGHNRRTCKNPIDIPRPSAPIE